MNMKAVVCEKMRHHDNIYHTDNDRPMVAEPGEYFTYNGGGMMALGEILKESLKPARASYCGPGLC